MAKQKGIIRLKGSIGGVTFYRSAGDDLARERTSLDKSKIETDPAFERTRENMGEFGASASVGKALRLGLAGIGRSFNDRYYISRLVKIMKEINARGPGLRGQRAFEIVANSDLLVGFELNSSAVLASIFNAPYTIVSNVQRNEATLTVPDFNTSVYITAPEGATHFRIVCAIAALSDYTYNTSTGVYEPTDPDENSLGDVIASIETPLGGNSGGIITLTPQLPGGPTLAATVGLIACIGIEFLQQVNAQYYLLGAGNGMRLVQVF